MQICIADPIKNGLIYVAVHGNISKWNRRIHMFTILTRIQTFISRYNAYHTARQELSNLSDRDLADIGIARCDIDRVARLSAKNI